MEVWVLVAILFKANVVGFFNADFATQAECERALEEVKAKRNPDFVMCHKREVE